MTQQRAHIRLVTIIAASELRDRLRQELLRLGASSYSVSRVEGRGEHGTRTRDAFDDGNIRFEALVTKPVAESILDYAATTSESQPIIAFAQDVEAVPQRHFEKK